MSKETTAGARKSISDDDICAKCSHCDYQPGELSGCKLDWPAQFNADDYAVKCESFAPELGVAVECGDCDWKGNSARDLEGGIADIENLWDILEPGTETPAGVCPECGSLAWVTHSPCQRHEDAVREFAAWLVAPATDAATLAHFKKIADDALENLRPHTNAGVPDKVRALDSAARQAQFIVDHHEDMKRPGADLQKLAIEIRETCDAALKGEQGAEPQTVFTLLIEPHNMPTTLEVFGSKAALEKRQKEILQSELDEADAFADKNFNVIRAKLSSGDIETAWAEFVDADEKWGSDGMKHPDDYYTVEEHTI